MKHAGRHSGSAPKITYALICVKVFEDYSGATFLSQNTTLLQLRTWLPPVYFFATSSRQLSMLLDIGAYFRYDSRYSRKLLYFVMINIPPGKIVVAADP